MSQASTCVYSWARADAGGVSPARVRQALLVRVMRVIVTPALEDPHMAKDKMMNAANV
jgi:hypothetical protein